MLISYVAGQAICMDRLWVVILTGTLLLCPETGGGTILGLQEIMKLSKLNVHYVHSAFNEIKLVQALQTQAWKISICIIGGTSDFTHFSSLSRCVGGQITFDPIFKSHTQKG